MRVLIHFIFLTFVLTQSLAWGAPSGKKPPSTTPNINDVDFDDNPSPVKTETTQPTYPRTFEVPQGWTPTQRPRPRSFTDFNIHVGTLGGDVLDLSDHLSTQYLGIRYISYRTFDGEPLRNFNRAWDFQADVHSQTLVSVSGGYRWSFERDDFFQSYYRVALADYIQASDGLGGLINLRHFKLLAALGSSDLFELHRLFCAEIGVGYGMGGFITYLQIGYNFNL